MKKIFNFLIIIFLFTCSGKRDKVKYKIFRYNQPIDITSLDPAFARNQGNIMAVNQLYNGLVELDKNMNIVPSIAKRWTISADGKAYTFYLNKNIYFHDNEVFKNGKGREVSALDFVFSFKRIIDKKTASPGAWIFNDKVLKANDSTFSDTCFKAINDTVLRIYLANPFPPLLQILSMPYAYVVPREAVEKFGKEFRIHPVGTGPFKFKIWEEKSAVVFLKNENYWKKDSAGNNLPYLDGVHISFIYDRNIAFMTFMQKKIDFISGLDENSRDMVFQHDGSIQPAFAEKYNVQKTPYMNTEYLGFQLDKSVYENKNHPILNKKVRQALNYAINKEQMVQYILSNVGTPGNHGFIPVSLYPTDQQYTKGYPYDINKAAKLLKEAGYPGGNGLPVIKLTTIVRFPYKEIAEFIQREWARLGVKLAVETIDYPTLLETVAQGKVEFFRASWEGDYPDPENYLALFYSKNFTPHGPNKTRYSNPQYDALYLKAMNEPDHQKRSKLYFELDQMATDEAPIVMLFYDEVVRLTQKNIKGLEANAMNSLMLEKVDIIQ